MVKYRLPTIFLPHGGGPCFFMDPMPGLPPTLWDGMAAYLRDIPTLIGTHPKALLVISAHWECPTPTVLNADQYDLLYDYYGFPEHTYHLTYPARGDAALAARIHALLAAANIAAAQEQHRGLDHGVFIPLKLAYPDADVPVVQLSLRDDLDPAHHLALGRALAPLRDEGVLIIGSGLSYHNLRDFFRPAPVADEASVVFDTWLSDTLSVAPDTRTERLLNWENAPGARACHPRSEHLLPLMVAVGAAMEDRGKAVYRERLLGKAVSAFHFG